LPYQNVIIKNNYIGAEKKVFRISIIFMLNSCQLSCQFAIKADSSENKKSNPIMDCFSFIDRAELISA